MLNKYIQLYMFISKFAQTNASHNCYHKFFGTSTKISPNFLQLKNNSYLYDAIGFPRTVIVLRLLAVTEDLQRWKPANTEFIAGGFFGSTIYLKQRQFIQKCTLNSYFDKRNWRIIALQFCCGFFIFRRQSFTMSTPENAWN